jgi:predicted ATPase/class 3 adenylate cyclase
MDFRILGPLAVSDRDEPVRLAGARQRALLALLLIRANRVVPADVLIEELWGEEIPRNAANALQAAVSRVRKAIGEERLRSQPPGYVLDVGVDELDLSCFERLAAEGRAALADGDGATASQRFALALELWRGPPLAEFAYEAFAQREISRLDELRLTVIEDRIEADLSVGRHASLVGELEALVGEQPLRERLRGQLMLALYRSGRQAEALERYQAARRAGVEELGIEPTRALRELEAAILRQDPALDLPAPSVPDRPGPPVAPVEPPREGRKVVTVVFSDVVESTALGEGLDPERLRSVMGRYFEAMSEVLELHGGSIEKYIGDAVMAVFGVPTMHEDDALRAVRAAEEMGGRLARLNRELERDVGVVLAARTGVNTGEVVVGEGRGGALVTGRAVNIAKRLEQAAQPGEVLLGEQTWEHVRDAVRCEPLEPLAVKGARGPVAAWRLLEIPADAGPPDRAAEVALVGRVDERTLLLRAFEETVSEGSCRLVTVLGQPGIGKSRLLREVSAELGERASTVLGRCLPYGEGITYWPLVEITRQLYGEDVRGSVARALGGDELDLLAVERIAAAVGLAGGPAAASEETHWSVRRLFEALAAEKPMVVVVEDIHWAEPTLLDLIEYLAGFASGPILLACAARPDLLEVRPAWAVPRAGAELVQLEPLSAGEAGELVERRLAGRPLPPDTRARIVEAAEGNPLFLDQMVALATEQPDAGDVLRVPPTINALLASRIDRLPEAERRLLERGAVEGRVFHRGALADLLPAGQRRDLAAGLMALVRRDLIAPHRSDYPGDDAFRFRHILIRDAAYASLPKERRAELHLGFAARLERVAGDRTLEHEEIAGYHLEQAFLYRAELGLGTEAEQRELASRAAARLEAAGRRAAERGDLHAACNLLERAVSVLAGDERRAALLPELGGVLIEAGRLDDAEVVLQEAVAAGDELVWAHARIQQLSLNLRVEPERAIGEFESHVEEIRRVFEIAGDELGLCRYRRLEGTMRWFVGRSDEAMQAWELGVEHARRARNQRELVDLLIWVASALFWGPTPAGEAISRCEQVRAEASADRYAEAEVDKRLAGLYAMAGDFDRARELLDRSQVVLEELPSHMYSATAEHAAFVARLAERPGDAEAALRAPLELLEEMGEKSFRSTQAALLAQSLAAQARYDEAAQFVEMAVDAAAPDDRYSQISWRAAKVSILIEAGELEDAERLAREGVALAERTDWLNDRADTWAQLALVIERAGRPDEAAEAVRTALELYERKGNTVGAAKARVSLAQLAVS